MHSVGGHGSLTSITRCLDHEVLAMDHMTTFSSAAAAVVASPAMVMSTGALGACKTTLRGELVQAPDRLQAVPRKFLVFKLFETTQDNTTSTEKRLETFQTFVVPNTRTTLPIPFALAIDQPKDCPSELELGVGAHDKDKAFIFTFGDLLLTGDKAIHLDKFEIIPVWAHVRRY
jgi:hypothetical protein